MELQDFIDANPWLEKCRCAACGVNGLVIYWWDNSPRFTTTEKWITYYKEEKRVNLFMDCCLEVTIYFKNWKSPTKQENEMFAMLYGHPFPWSEEQPFVWED